MEPLPLRFGLRGARPYLAPQLDAPARLNANESGYPPPAALLTDLADELARAARHLHRYPDPDATGLRAVLADYLTEASERRLRAGGGRRLRPVKKRGQS